MTDADVLPIVQCGDPVLRRPAQPVPTADMGGPGLLRLVGQMRATMRAAPGVGLAAPQVGTALQLAVMEDGPDRWGGLGQDQLTARERGRLGFTVLVNPSLTVIEREGDAVFFEGCLSVPGLTGLVRRWRAVRIDGFDEHGQAQSRVFTGWAARIAQHELDHLAGGLYLDRAETRSISTVANYVRYWASEPLALAATALGFELPAGPR